MHLMQKPPAANATDKPLAPPGAWRRNPIVRLFSSITFGIILMTLILTYACLLSAVLPLRGALEVTEMQAFRHWLFVSLIVLFCIVLITATLVRIRFTVINLGVLTVHTGLLLLAGGSIVYFGGKVEGDVFLASPRVEIITLAGQRSREIGRVLAESGEGWSQVMPAFGGRVSVEVLETGGAGLAPVQSARVRAIVGDQPPRELSLRVPDQPLAAITDRLAVRLVTFPPQDTFYDQERPALFYRRLDQDPSQRRAVPLDGLPLHRERYLDEGAVLHDTVGRPVPTKRTWPHVDLLGWKLPTGWFEPWRMPIRPATPDLRFTVEVTGYVPFVAGMESSAVPGGESDGAAATFAVSFDSTRFRETLFADDPVHSISSRANLEFRWVAGEAEQRAALAPLVGPHELTIEVVDPPVKQTVAIQAGQTIRVEGTSYELTITEIAPDWPLMTPGYENARSPVARVDVACDGKRYNRTVVQRFPHLSQDIDETGVRHRDGPYDPNLRLTYRGAGQGWAALVAGPGLTPQLGFFGIDGSVRPLAIEPGQTREIRTSDGSVSFTLVALLPHAREEQMPVIEPLEVRRPGMGRDRSAIRVRLSGSGPAGAWSESRWLPFSTYPTEDASPLTVVVPGEPAAYELFYSRVPHPLGAILAGRKLSVEFFPGRQVENSWRSDFVAQIPGRDAQPMFVQTNDTATVGPLTLFQASAARDHWSFTILGVGNRRGIWPMGIGCILIPLGCLYAFYVKPILKRRIVQRALEAAQARAATAQTEA